jgi:hypothetical protein
MSFITEGTGSFFTGAAKVDANPSALPAENKLVAAEANEIHDALLNIRSQFAVATELDFNVSGALHVTGSAGSMSVGGSDQALNVWNDTAGGSTRIVIRKFSPADTTVDGIDTNSCDIEFLGHDEFGADQTFGSVGGGWYSDEMTPTTAKSLNIFPQQDGVTVIGKRGSNNHLMVNGSQSIAQDIHFMIYPDEVFQDTTEKGRFTYERVSGIDASELTSQPYFYMLKSGSEVYSSCGVAPYDVAGYFGGNPAVSGTVMSYLSARDFTFYADWANSIARSEVSASQGQDFRILVGGVHVGTITFSTSSNDATFSGSGEVNVIAGDVIKVQASGAQDTTLADIHVTLAGYYTGLVL